MATKVKATVEIECWKEHQCVGCGAIFRYPLKLSSTRERETEEDAREAAQRSVDLTLDATVEAKPCPTCGIYQPDMLQPFGHGCLTLLLFLPLAALTVLGIWLAGGFFAPYPVLYPIISWLAVIACGLATFAHIRMATRNPDRDLQANRRHAEELLKAGTLRLISPGQPPGGLAKSVPPRLSILHWLAMFVLVAGTVAVGAAELVRLAAGWPWNLSTDPIVVGPGDELRIYLPAEIKTVKGHWNGRANIEILNREELGFTNAPYPVYSKADNWGSVIFGKGSKEESARLWVGTVVPDAPSLSGKTIRMHISLDVTYAAPHGFLGFQNESKEFDHSTELRLAAPHAGWIYRLLWWAGGAVGGSLVLLVGYGLSRLAKKRIDKAIPARVIFPTREAPSVLPAD